LYVSVQITAIADGTSNTILFGEFSNFDPNWPQYASFLGSPANFPLSLVASVWAVGGYRLPSGSGYFPLNYSLPPSPPKPVNALNDPLNRFWAYGSGHPGGANFVFCDGSVHFISNAINNAAWVITSAPFANGDGVKGPAPIPLLGALCTRAGGEVVDASQY